MYEFPNPTRALECLLALLDDGEVSGMVGQFDGLLAHPIEQLVSDLHELSVHLDPRLDYGWDEREWLQSLRARAAQELDERRGGAGQDQ